MQNRHKGYYGVKIRHSNLEVGICDLGEKKWHKGIWDTPFVVIGNPAPDIRVYEAMKENAQNTKQ